MFLDGLNIVSKPFQKCLILNINANKIMFIYYLIINPIARQEH